MNTLDIQWSRDPKNGDLIGTVSFTPEGGAPRSFMARANERLIHSRLVKRYLPGLVKAATAGAIPYNQLIISGPGRRYLAIAGAIARHQISSDLERAVDQALHGKYVATGCGGVSGNSPGQQLMSAINNPIVKVALDAALSALLGPASVVAKLAPLVLDSATKVIAKADRSEPQALGYVADLVSKAQRGDPAAINMINLIKVMKAPLPPSVAPPASIVQSPMPAGSTVTRLTPMQLPPIPQPSPAALPFASRMFSSVSGWYPHRGEPMPGMLLRDAEVSGVSGAGASANSKRPAERELALQLLRRAAQGHKPSLEFLGKVQRDAKAHDQPAVRMQTILTNAAQMLSKVTPVAKAAVSGLDGEEFAISGDQYLAVAGGNKILPEELVSRLSYIDEVLKKPITPAVFRSKIDPQKIVAWWKGVLDSDARQRRRADWSAMHDYGPKSAPDDWVAKHKWFWFEKSQKNRQTYRGRYISDDSFLGSVARIASDVGDVLGEAAKETIPGANVVAKALQGKSISPLDFAPGSVHHVLNTAEKIATGKKVNVTDVINSIVPGATQLQQGMKVVHSVPGLYAIASMVPGLNVALPTIDLGLQAMTMLQGGKFNLGTLMQSLPFVSQVPGVAQVLAAAKSAGVDKIGDVIDLAKKSGLSDGAAALANVVSTVAKVTGGKAVPALTNLQTVHALADQHMQKKQQEHVKKLVRTTAVATAQHLAQKPQPQKTLPIAPIPRIVQPKPHPVQPPPRPVQPAPRPVQRPAPAQPAAPLGTEGGPVSHPNIPMPGSGWTQQVAEQRELWRQGQPVPEFMRRWFEAEQAPPVTQELVNRVWGWLNAAVADQVPVITDHYQQLATGKAPTPLSIADLCTVLTSHLTMEQLQQLQSQAPELAPYCNYNVGPVGVASGNAVAWAPGYDPADGIAVAGLAAYVPPNERDLRHSGTMQKALTIMRNVAAEQPEAKSFVARMRQQHQAGDVTASAMLWFLHQAYLMLGAQDSATSGESVAYGENAWNPAPMSLQNYFTISGLMLSPFYRHPAIHFPGIGDNVVTPEAELDVIIGAAGKPLKKTWNGKRWVWTEVATAAKLPAPFVVRPKRSGVRDLMLHGMQAMQRRQLAT